MSTSEDVKPGERVVRSLRHVAARVARCRRRPSARQAAWQPMVD
jgi:hypothetical protein